MQTRRLADTDWSPLPQVSAGVAGFSAFVVMAIGTLLINQSFDEDSGNGLRIVIFIGAALVASGVIAASRGHSKMRSLGRLTCEDDGLRIGPHLIPYRSIRTIRFTPPEIALEGAAEGGPVDTEIEIHIFRRFFPLRFVALDTVVDDLLMGLDRVDKENPDALVAPYMPRKMKPL